MVWYSIEQVTGSDLVDAHGRHTGPESTGRVVSKHRTYAGARRELNRLKRLCPLVQYAILLREKGHRS